MKPTKIPEILDLALEARKKGLIFNPLFTGEAGLGKSALVQAWVREKQKKNKNFFFYDLRLAYLEAPDLIGFPKEVFDEKTKEYRTIHCAPEFWPMDPDLEGLLLLEEPNRGTTGVTNCLMQILTDRQIHKIKLPKGIIIAGCINPESDKYDVNNMDAALKNRFEEFEVEFDHLEFLNYAEASQWDDKIQRFIGSGVWIYKTTSEVADKATYISPRTWSKVEAAEKAGAANDRVIHRIVVTSILGKDIGQEYHKFCYDQAPVMAKDLLKNKKTALSKLKEQSDPNNYKGDMIAQTVESIIKEYGGLKEQCKPDQVDEELMVEVAKIIPSDQTVNLLKGCGFKYSGGKMVDFLKDFRKRHPDLVDILRSNIKVSRAVDK